jgi:hypothetical protein
MPRKPAPLGSEYINPNGVVYIKVAMSKKWSEAWKTKGRVILEQKLKRKLESNEKVIKHNGRKQDFTLDNLRVVNKAKKESYIVLEDSSVGTRDLYEWSQFHKQCVSCETTSHKHAANGLCTSCYNKKRLQDGFIGGSS